MHASRRWLLLSPLLMTLGQGAPLQADDRPAPPPVKEIQAPIVSVTVYSDRARVTRRAGGIESGRSLLCVTGLPDGLQDDSVRVSLPDHPSARILSVEVARRFLDKFSSEEALTRQEYVRTLEEEGKRLAAREASLARENELLQGLSVGAQPNPGQQAQAKALTPEAWSKILDAVDQGLTDNAKARLEAARTRRDWERRIAAARQSLQEVQSYHRSAEKTVTVSVDVPEVPQTVNVPRTMELSYLISGARWSPSYDVRVLPEEGRIQVVRFAEVRQRTGEDWTDAALVFSTAVPAVSATLPDLLAWRIAEAPPRPTSPALQPSASRHRPAEGMLKDSRDKEEYSLDGLEAAESKKVMRLGIGGGKGDDPNGEGDSSFNSDDSALRGESLDIEREVKNSYGRSNRGLSRQAGEEGASRRRWIPPCQLAAGYDYAFPALKPETVKNDGSSRRIALGTDAFATSLRYEAAPLVSPFAYLACDLKNDTKAPYLAGQTNIFLAGDFLGEAELGTVGMGETATIPLGVDEKLKVTRKARDVKGSAGLFGTKERTRTEVELTASSFLKAPVTLRLLDRLPYSFQDDIQVEEAAQALPPPSEKSAKGLLVWNLTLQPGKSQTVTFSYAVKTPDDFDLFESPDLEGAK